MILDTKKVYTVFEKFQVHDAKFLIVNDKMPSERRLESIT